VTMFSIRFDMRSPAGGAPTADLYAAALEMTAFAEEHGFAGVAVSEHHETGDGFLPSPLVLASAIAGRTRRIPIAVAALLVPLYEPIRLAADIAVLDHVSGGRVSYVTGIGYREVEYDLFARSFRTRGADVERQLAVVLRALTGERFEYGGRVVQLLPTPRTQPHPRISYGGGTVAAARRAARLDLPFYPQTPDEGLVAAYREERERLGRPPVPVISPRSGPLNTFVAEDPDRLWARIGPALLHDATTYAAWHDAAGLASAALARARTVEELRTSGVYVIATPEECVAQARRDGFVSVHPLCGGVDPEVGWETLHLIASRVMPRLAT
jgi:alkanesulfonate monooxygenase SsuD/methylene tetrahydromethanopterin reductase-like flavin-dependent oxidoreductase (luciferase family)